MAETTEARWGAWTHDPKAEALYLPAEIGGGYYVELDTIHDTADIDRWVSQVSEKRWATPAITADLRAALCDLTGAGAYP